MMKTRTECCNHTCEQGDACPLRVEKRSVASMIRHPLSPEDFTPPPADRRTGPSILWRLFGWILRERRSGFDRRK